MQCAGLCGLALLLTLGVASAAQPAAGAAASAGVRQTVDALRRAALSDTNGHALLEELVTRVGPRPAGTEAEARARQWAVAALQRQGFTNVRVDPFTTPSWQASVERLALLDPGSQQLSIVALGGSPSTPAGGVSGEVLRFESLAALQSANPDRVRGRIVYIDEHMPRTRDGSGYGAAVGKRRNCGIAARQLGALACLIRSAGTNDDRFAHQGWAGAVSPGEQAPSAALAPPDANVLSRLLAGGGTARVWLELETRFEPAAPSGNVLAEIVGREQPREFVLAAAHLDSWSHGQGALDDGAGVAIITAAARLINDLPVRPRRSIRLLLAGAEEPVNSDTGGRAYRDAHQQEHHVAAAESDVGDGRVWRLRGRPGKQPVPLAALREALAPLGIEAGEFAPAVGGGSDIGPLVATGVSLVALNQDASRYFDFHHTANDTLERVRIEDLRQNIAAWAVTLYLLAELDGDAGTAADPAPR
ncbi:MAG TPA: M20/M25/M40 family metallo-hydrolase [Steroidobacteraceae bacterium]|nr:M20/M25/M40 family metallo-hydrolase [Steroidobacteraceae bacterium]